MNKCVDLIGLSIGNSVIVNEMNEVQRMKKRILSAALALCMMFGSAAALPQGIFGSETSITASAITSGDYTYTELSDGTAQITRYNGSSTSITIPPTIDGKTVTSVKRLASTLKANTTLASVTIPSSVKTVEEGAFRYCQALTSVTFKGDIDSIGSAAFDGCIKLTTMKLPNGIKTLPANLFCGCTSLTSVTIPASVTSVSSKVFGSPDNESLGDLCTKLQTITVDPGNSSLCSVDGVLYNKAKTAIIWCPYDKTSLNIPGTVKSIPADTIYCKATSITLNSGTQSIAAQALVFCPQLKTITIPASVTNLGSQSVGYTKASIFDEATKIQSFTIRGYKGSAAEKYAKDNNFTFVSIGTSCTHSYTASSWAWTDYSAAKVTLKCSKCSETTQVSANISSSVTKDATCTATGTKTYTATATVGSQNFKDQKTETIAAKGHSYSTTPTWSWNGTTSATASFKCIRCTDTKTVNATITSKTTPATTTADGKTVYTATATYNGKSYTDTKTVTIPKLNCTHSYAVSSWTWSGYSSAKVNLKCSKCGDTRTVDAMVTSSVTKAATCTTAGVRTYAATVTFNSKNYYDTKTETIAATGHNYVAKTIAPTCTAQGYTEHTCSKCHSSYNDNYKAATGHTFGEAPEWKWAADYSSATATFKCTKEDHVETINASISKTVKAATCAAKGSTTYNATVNFGGKAYSDVKSVTIPATGNHTYVTKTYAPTCKAEGYTEHKCSVCGHTYKTDVKSKVDHKWGSWKVIKAATETSTGTQEHTCTVCGAKETATIPKTTHKHSYTTKVVAPTCTDQGYTLHTCSCGYSYKDTYKNATGHSYTTKVTAPTCTAKGYTTHTCTKCKTSYKDSYTNPTGHKWNSGTITTQPTVIKTGVKTYTCTACKKTKTEAVNKLSLRLFGKSRYETSMAIATQLKKENGNKAFTSVIIASGTSNADALSAAYLAKVKNAPILITAPSETTAIVNYIKANAASTAKIYIVGGTGAVNADTEKKLKAIYKTTNQVVRLGGKTRFETNLLVLKEAKVSNQEILVASGMDYPDALSASAVGLPILLVSGNTLTAEQQTYLKSLKSTKITIVGGNGAVSAGVESSIKALKKFATPTRLGGSNRYETSLMVANKYFASAPTMAVAYGLNFPDGLCGGPLAMKYKCPLLLATSKDTTSAHTYAYTHKETNTVTFGGTALVSDSAVKAIVG